MDSTKDMGLGHILVCQSLKNGYILYYKCHSEYKYKQFVGNGDISLRILSVRDLQTYYDPYEIKYTADVIFPEHVYSEIIKILDTKHNHACGCKNKSLMEIIEIIDRAHNKVKRISMRVNELKERLGKEKPSRYIYLNMLYKNIISDHTLITKLAHYYIRNTTSMSTEIIIQYSSDDSNVKQIADILNITCFDDVYKGITLSFSVEENDLHIFVNEFPEDCNDDGVAIFLKKIGVNTTSAKISCTFNIDV